MRFAYRFKQIILLFGDIATFFVGFWLALAVRHLGRPNQSELIELLPLFAVVFFLWIVSNYINGLYDLSSRIGKRASVKRFLETAVIALFIGISYFYITADGRITPKTILVLAVLFGYSLSGLWHMLHRKLIRIDALSHNILFIGYTKETEELFHLLKDHPKGYNITALLDPHASNKDLPQGCTHYTEVSKIRSIINTHDIHLVVIASEMKEKEEAKSELYELLFWPVHMIDLTTFYEELTGRIPPSTFSETWFLEHLKQSDYPIYNKIRRLVDLVAIVIILAILAVLFIPVALAITLTSKGPLFIRQERIGHGGIPFTLYKFRSMYALSPDGSAEVDGVQFAKKKDDRITAVGNILRKTRIDELPQVVNLLKGNITLIGPRPERPEIVAELTARMPYYPLRHLIKPGLTGWAVLHQDYTDDLETSLQKLQYDLYYIKNRSVLLDTAIFLKTINIIVRAKGQ